MLVENYSNTSIAGEADLGSVSGIIMRWIGIFVALLDRIRSKYNISKLVLPKTRSWGATNAEILLKNYS